ncbi:MAG: GntR family transcriptional regulator [Planctomycetota bacterium]|nr:GntR family transcriptional regulator [Planctomycetota bacterium]
MSHGDERICTEQQRVAGRLLAQMVRGELAPGTRLPAERDLASRFEVSRRTVNLALELLQEQGLVHQVSPRIRHVADDITARLSAMRAQAVVIRSRRYEPCEPGSDDAMADDVIAGIRDQGFEPLIYHPEDLDREHLRALVTRSPVSLVLLGQAANTPAGQAAAREFLAIEVPVVGYTDVMRHDAAADFPVDRVQSDQRAGGRLVAERLITAGAKRLLRFWDVDSAFEAPQHWLCERDAGVLEALAAAGLPVIAPPDPVRVANGTDPSRAAFDRMVRIVAGFLAEYLLAENPVDAVLAKSDKEFIYVAAACRLLGREPGRDILITGYDHTLHRYPELRWEPARPFVTVDKRMGAIGRAMLTLMNERVAGTLTGPPVTRTLEPELVLTKH